MTAYPGPGNAPDASVTLARIEVKLDAVLRTNDDHESRIRALESRNWPRQSLNLWVAGLSAAAAGAAVFQGVILK
ncbi:MAG: hypothetical protein HOY76_18575 [Streptomyces sp.]|nr:hypothetical protein [Streptomyces sp.]